MLRLVAAALRQLERRAAREVRHEAVEQDVLAVGGAAHGAAQRGRAGRVQRQARAVHQRRARQHHGVRAAPLAAVAPRPLQLFTFYTHYKLSYFIKKPHRCYGPGLPPEHA